jgi:parvulin-like peptidyl-prolyl isomerase
MRYSRFLLLFTLLLALLAAGCGSDEEEAVPANAIAVVDDQEVAKAQFDELMAYARKNYTAQDREWPKAGTPEHNTLKFQAVQLLVQRAQFEQKATELGVQVTDKDVDERLKQIKEQYFGGDQKKYEEQLKEQGLTEEQVRRDLRANLIQEKLTAKVTSAIKVTDKEIEQHYKKNKDQYGQPASRDVRHILVPTRKQAVQIRSQLAAGGDFAKLAKKHSKDPGSAAQGGKLTVSRGQTVPTFDKAAFSLGVNALSQPIKTTYGFHIIQPLSKVKPAATTPLTDVKESIKQQLLQTKKNDRMTAWFEETKKEYEEKTRYQVGFSPPATTTGTDGAEEDSATETG